MENKFTIPDEVNRVTMTKENGAWVVVFEPENAEFKDGDILIDENYYIGILKNKTEKSFLFYVLLPVRKLCIENVYCSIHDWTLATPEQQQILFDALAKEGKQWNAEKKCIEPLKWVPKEGEQVCRVIFSTDENKFTVYSFTWQWACKINDCIFSNRKEAQQLCDKLNIILLNEKRD